eukprot:9388642-Pyramimonas_sp.AAC.1
MAIAANLYRLLRGEVYGQVKTPKRASTPTLDCESEGNTVREGGYTIWRMITGYQQERHSGIPGARLRVEYLAGSGTQNVSIKGLLEKFISSDCCGLWDY